MSGTPKTSQAVRDRASAYRASAQYQRPKFVSISAPLIQREAAAEIEVAADQLLERGWPVSRMKLLVQHDGDVTRTQLMLTRGVEFPRDQVVFECRRTTTTEATRIATRIAGYWIVPLTAIAPSASTIAEALR